MKPSALLNTSVAFLAGFVTVVLVARTVEFGWVWEPFLLGVICGSLFQTGVLILVSVFRGWRR